MAANRRLAIIDIHIELARQRKQDFRTDLMSMTTAVAVLRYLGNPEHTFNREWKFCVIRKAKQSTLIGNAMNGNVLYY